MSINNCRPVKLLSDENGEVIGVWTTVQWRPFPEIVKQLRAVDLDDEADRLEEALTRERGYSAAEARLYASSLAAIHNLTAHSEWSPTEVVEHMSSVGIRLFTHRDFSVTGSQTLRVNTNLNAAGHCVRLEVQGTRIVAMKRLGDSHRVSEVILEKGHDLLPYLYPIELEHWA